MTREALRRLRERADGSLHLIMLALVLAFLAGALGLLSIWAIVVYPTVDEALQLAADRGETRRALKLLSIMRSEWRETILTLAGITVTPCFALLAGIFGYRTGKKRSRNN